MSATGKRLPLAALVSFLDDYLDIDKVPDYPDALNGLQVENSGRVQKVAACTDACQATIDAAAEAGADLMLVHHGLFWGQGLQPLTGRRYARVAALLGHDIAVYSAHLPLDAHPDVGNNALLAVHLGLQVRGRFADFQGTAIGVYGDLDLARSELAERLQRVLGPEPFVIPGGPDRVQRVGIVTGGASDRIVEARDIGLDTFITGEGPHHTFFDAEEGGINVIYAGHYATETLGVKAIAALLCERFGCEWEFIDHPTGL